MLKCRLKLCLYSHLIYRFEPEMQHLDSSLHKTRGHWFSGQFLSNLANLSSFTPIVLSTKWLFDSYPCNETISETVDGPGDSLDALCYFFPLLTGMNFRYCSSAAWHFFFSSPLAQCSQIWRVGGVGHAILRYATFSAKILFMPVRLLSLAFSVQIKKRVQKVCFATGCYEQSA